MEKNYHLETDTERIKKELEVMKILEGTDSEIRKRLEKISDDKENVADFLDGLAMELDYISVSYRYKDFRNICNFIRYNYPLIIKDEKLTNSASKIIDELNNFDILNEDDKTDYNIQYIGIQEDRLCLRKKGLSLPKFNEKAIDIFNQILDGDVDDVKKDACYLPTVLYLVYNHPSYFINDFPKFDEVTNSLISFKRSDFSSFKDYCTNFRISEKALFAIARQVKENNRVKKK